MSIEPLILTRHFKAPPERVFAAFTENALMQGWYGPEAMTTPHCEVDARVGGKYRIEMHAKTGSVNIVTGEFKEVEPPRRLVFSWGWLNGAGRNPETTVTVTFEPSQGGTALTLRQEGFLKEEFREGHREGWTSGWNALDAMLDGRPKAQTPGPILLGVQQSTYTRAARIAFFEKGVAHQLEPVAPRSAELFAHNPFGKMPVLKLGEDALYETSAIVRYIDEVYPGPSLMPATPLARAKAEQWISAINAYADAPIVRRYLTSYFFPSGADGKPDRETIERAIPEIRQMLAALEAAYGADDYLVDNAPSAPDMLLAPMIGYLPAFPEGRELLDACPNVKRAHAAFAARPSFIAATQGA